MINVTVGGATGKLGRIVCELVTASDDMKLVGAIVSPNGGNVGKELYGVIASGPADLDRILEITDVYVDLTSPDAAARVLPAISSKNVNIILGTTAVPKNIIDTMEENVMRNMTSAVISANFSKGVNVFWKMCQEMAEYLPDYDMEVVEIHHHAKKDAPSGTTLETVRRLQASSGIDKVVHGREGVVGARTREIGVHAIRAGDVVGDHTVIFAKDMERLDLSHKAISRETLARGCLDTIRWIAGRKDGLIHNMGEVFGL